MMMMIVMVTMIMVIMMMMVIMIGLPTLPLCADTADADDTWKIAQAEEHKIADYVLVIRTFSRFGFIRGKWAS